MVLDEPKKLHFSLRHKTCSVVLLKRLQEFCVPGLISTLSDLTVYVWSGVVVFFIFYVFNPLLICRKMILLSTQQFKMVVVQSFVTFFTHHTLIIAGNG